MIILEMAQMALKGFCIYIYIYSTSSVKVSIPKYVRPIISNQMFPSIQFC